MVKANAFRGSLLLTLCAIAFLGLSCKNAKSKKTLKASGHQINNAAYWDGAVWFIETAGQIDEDGDGAARSFLIRLDDGPGKEPQKIVALDAVEPWLLADEDRLWVLSNESIATYSQGRLETKRLVEPLEEVSRPFLYQGRPAIIASRPPGYILLALEDGRWQEREKLRLKLPAESDSCTGEYLQAFEYEGQVHVFCQVPLAAPVYYHEGLPLADAPQNWQKVADAGGQWKAVCLEGKPAFFFHANRGGLAVLGLIYRNAQWQELMCRSIGLDIGLGVCPTGTGEDFVLLRRILPLGMEVLRFKDAQPAWCYNGHGQTNLPALVTAEE